MKEEDYLLALLMVRKALGLHRDSHDDLVVVATKLRAENERLKAELSAIRASGSDTRSVEGPGGGGPSDWPRQGGGSGNNSKTQVIEIPGPAESGGGDADYLPICGGGIGYIPRGASGGPGIEYPPRGKRGDAGVAGSSAALVKTPDEVNPLLALAQLGKWTLDMRGESNCADLCGGDIQDKATQLGLLCAVTVTESCGDGCNCADYGDWPLQCYRMTDKAKVLE